MANASWIIGCKIAQSILGLFIGILCARFMGPSNFGVINYAASLVGFVTPLMRLGLNSILVNEITTGKESESKIIGTAIGMAIPAGVLSSLAIVAFVSLYNKGDTVTIVVCSIYSATLVFQAAEMIIYWYQAKLMSKYPSIATVIGYVAVSAYKVYLLISAKSVYWFAAINAMEHLIICAILMVLYFKLSKQKLQFSTTTAKQMLSKSKHYILSGTMVAIYQQTDKFMLKNMIGNAEAGYYSVAIACAGVAGFVYAAIIDSLRPTILTSKKCSEQDYRNKMSVLYAIVLFLALGQSLVMTLFAKPMISILYGEAYMRAVPVLQLTVWYVVCSYFAIVRDIWILAEGQQKYLWVINIFGATINILLNWILIPVAGAMGAALASLGTNLFTSFVACSIIKPIRPIWKIILKACDIKFISTEIRKTFAHH